MSASNALRSFARPLTAAAALFAAALIANACGGVKGPGANSANGAIAPGATGAGVAGGESSGDYDSYPCGPSNWDDCISHAQALTDMVDELRGLGDAKDIRVIPVAIRALAARDAEVRAEGLRLLAPFSAEDGVDKAALPFLADPRPELQRLASFALRGSSAGSDVQTLWKLGHPDDEVEYDPREHEPAFDATRPGFVRYDGATTHFPPAESDSSGAFSTSDGPETVTAFYEAKSGKKFTDEAGFREKAKGYQQAVMTSYTSMSAEARSGDGAKKLEKKLRDVIALGGSENRDAKDLKVLVVDEKDGMPLRAIQVYTSRAYGKTIAVMWWDAAAVGVERAKARPILLGPIEK